MKTAVDEVLTLSNLYCEQLLDETQLERLQQLLRAESAHLDVFINYVQLHGQLTWNAGRILPQEPQPTAMPAAEHDASELVPERSKVRPANDANRIPDSGFRRTFAGLAIVAAILFMAFARLLEQDSTTGKNVSAAGSNASEADEAQPSPIASVTLNEANAATSAENRLPPLPINALNRNGTANDRRSEDALTAQDAAVADTATAGGIPLLPDGFNDALVIASINRHVAKGWEENNVQPSARAGDAEWVRRAYLTFAGRIPATEEALNFMAADSVRKRSALVDRLLADPRAAENLAVIWTNLLIGRSNPRAVNEDALFAFLEHQFAENRPWMDTVGQLIAARGRSDENGATNFLLAHLNNEATPATAVTARLFLAEQVHCTQCHDHPFAKDVKQSQFWALNAFFKQVRRQPVVTDAAKPILVSMADGRQRRVWELQDDSRGGMTFYETRSGQQKAVLPAYEGESLSEEAGINRREEFVRMLQHDPSHKVARAMVNRTWAHFFGYGFTNPIDDLGSHNVISHPELFDMLTEAFVASDYDVRRLMRWVALSEAWQLSSEGSPDDSIDVPDSGGQPLFTRVYARHMDPEQVYESIRTAILSVASRPIASSIGTEHRRLWVEQFVQAYGNDDNEELLQFEGNVSQAMMMMNGARLEESIPLAVQALLTTSPAAQKQPAAEGLNRIAMASVSREATEDERRAFRNRYRSLGRQMPNSQAAATALEDMLWAYLNSSEFVSVH